MSLHCVLSSTAASCTRSVYQRRCIHQACQTKAHHYWWPRKRLAHGVWILGYHSIVKSVYFVFICIIQHSLLSL